MRLELVTIPRGAFAMGSEHGQPDERPVHRVWVDEFALAVHPVTNEQYARFLAATGRRAPSTFTDPRFDRPRQPVVGVNWFDASAYCAWFALKENLPCRLPTEAEREKAARGGVDGARYPWGDAPSPPSGVSRTGTVHDVGLDAPNALGLHNTGDLVHEWCSDWYGDDWYGRSPSTNPTGPPTGTRRSSRGGSWRHQVPVSRCAARSALAPERCYTDYGFRVAVGPIVVNGA